MIRHLSYIIPNKSSDLPQQIKADKMITEDEFNLICECSQVIGKFNVFCDYYYMLEKSFNEALSYLAMVESRDYKLKNQMDKHVMITEMNRLFIGTLNMFYNYATYYLIDIIELFDKDSEEYKKVKSTQSKYFDANFEYRLLYGLRNYTDHGKLPITIVSNNAKNNVRCFLISKDEMSKCKYFNRNLKNDIKKLTDNINVKDILIKSKKFMFELHKEISLIDEHNVLFSYTYLKKYLKKDGFPCVVSYKSEESKEKGQFEISLPFDELQLVGYNIRKMGFGAIASFKNGEGFYYYDPYNLMFTKEQKEKLKLE